MALQLSAETSLWATECLPADLLVKLSITIFAETYGKDNTNTLVEETNNAGASK
jgi:hypothetical protein